MPPFLIPLLGTIVNNIASAFGLDTSSEETKVKLAQIQLDSAKILSDQMTGQMEVNKAEASSADPFTSRWRPLIGYICGVAFGYHFVLQPLLVFLVVMYTGKIPALPMFDISTLTTVLMGMLGLGAMRSYDKKNGL